MDYLLISLDWLSRIALLVLALYVVWKSRVITNIQAIDAWFGSMDVVVGGQRYRGNRSAAYFTLHHGRCLAGMGYEIETMCRTRSGRIFVLRVKSMLGRILSWDLSPGDPEEFERLRQDNLEACKKIDELLNDGQASGSPAKSDDEGAMAQGAQLQEGPSPAEQNPEQTAQAHEGTQKQEARA